MTQSSWCTLPEKRNQVGSKSRAESLFEYWDNIKFIPLAWFCSYIMSLYPWQYPMRIEAQVHSWTRMRNFAPTWTHSTKICSIDPIVAQTSRPPAKHVSGHCCSRTIDAKKCDNQAQWVQIQWHQSTNVSGINWLEVTQRLKNAIVCTLLDSSNYIEGRESPSQSHIRHSAKGFIQWTVNERSAIENSKVMKLIPDTY